MMGMWSLLSVNSTMVVSLPDDCSIFVGSCHFAGEVLMIAEVHVGITV
jgi:hypothetical protein